MKKLCLLIITTVFLLPLYANSKSTEAGDMINTDATSAKWWCNWAGQIVECEMNEYGLIAPTAAEYLVYKYFFDDYENALKVFTCESGVSQYWKNGEVIISKTNDIGIAQINLTTHQKRAESLGLDLLNSEMNIIYARI